MTSCSHEVIVVDNSKNKIEAKWLDITTEHALKNYVNDEKTHQVKELVIPHPFYDIEISDIKKSKMKYYPLTYAGESTMYDFDLLSGSRYKVRSMCKFSDAWKSFGDDLELPNYTEAIVPGVFNQQNVPMKMLVFSESNNQFPRKLNEKYFDEANVVGSILIEECESYPCNNKDKWKKSQILIGVQASDSKLSSYENIFEMKKNVDWDYARAFIVNSKGAHQLGNLFLPAFRISSELGPKETIQYFEKNSKVINLKSEAIARESCINLQEEIWNEFDKIRKEPHFQKDKFKEFFINFITSQKEHYALCDKLVRPANLNLSYEKHWFFTFISLFVNLEKEGMYYNCASNGWFYNPKVEEGKFYVSQAKEIEKCSEKDVERAFDQAINALGSMKNQLNKFFRYIEYDSGQGGSHERIYNWIRFDNRRLACEKEKAAFDFFPQDVVWQVLKEDEEKVVH